MTTANRIRIIPEWAFFFWSPEQIDVVYKTINLSFGLVKTTVWTVSSVASYTILLGCAQGFLAVSAILALYRVFGLRAPPSICF